MRFASFVAHALSEITGFDTVDTDEVNGIQDAFDYFDKNNDYLISSSEYAMVMKYTTGVEPSTAEIQYMMSMADFNGDGFIGYLEYLAINNVILIREGFRGLHIEDNGIANMIYECK